MPLSCWPFIIVLDSFPIVVCSKALKKKGWAARGDLWLLGGRGYDFTLLHGPLVWQNVAVVKNPKEQSSVVCCFSEGRKQWIAGVFSKQERIGERR